MNNCFFFALSRWFRRGGYLVIRRSRFGCFPHFIWCGDLKDAKIEHFVPVNPVRRIFPPILFRGKIKDSDV